MDGLHSPGRQQLLELGVGADAIERELGRASLPVALDLDSNQPLAVAQLQVARRVDRRQPTVDDQCDAVAQFVGRGHVVGRQEHGASGVALRGDELPDGARAHRVETRRGLVEEQELGRMQQSPRYPQAILHALRVIARAYIDSVGQTDRREQFGRRTGLPLVQSREVVQILDAGELGEVIR